MRHRSLKNEITIKTSLSMTLYEYNCIPCYQTFKYICVCFQRYITGNYFWTSSTSVFDFIGINAMYTISNFYHNHFKCDHAIGPTLHYLR